jgi:Mrp family chromosome partitioning ATPase
MGPALLVTSALDDDASSAVVAGLGVVLAQAGQDVVCVEADAVHSRVRMLLATPDEAADSREGVASIVMGKIAVAEAFLDVPVPPSNNGGVAVTDASGSHLMVLPLGVSSNALAPKSSETLGDLVLELSIQAKHVLFDCPRLLSVAHGLPLASAVDGVLVVARDGRIGRGRAAEVRAALDSVSVENVGVVLIEDRPRPARRSRGAFLAALRREHLPRWRR